MAFGASTAGDDSALPRTEEDVPRLGQHKRGRVVQAQGKLSAEDAKAKRGRNCIILICSTNVIHGTTVQVQQHLPSVNHIARDFADRLERVRYINDEVNDLKTEVGNRNKFNVCNYLPCLDKFPLTVDRQMVSGERRDAGVRHSAGLPGRRHGGVGEADG